MYRSWLLFQATTNRFIQRRQTASLPVIHQTIPVTPSHLRNEDDLDNEIHDLMHFPRKHSTHGWLLKIGSNVSGPVASDILEHIMNHTTESQTEVDSVIQFALTRGAIDETVFIHYLNRTMSMQRTCSQEMGDWRDWLGEMDKYGLKPSDDIVASLLRWYGANGSSHQAQDVWDYFAAKRVIDSASLIQYMNVMSSVPESPDKWLEFCEKFKPDCLMNNNIVRQILRTCSTLDSLDGIMSRHMQVRDKGVSPHLFATYIEMAVSLGLNNKDLQYWLEKIRQCRTFLTDEMGRVLIYKVVKTEEELELLQTTLRQQKKFLVQSFKAYMITLSQRFRKKKPLVEWFRLIQKNNIKLSDNLVSSLILFGTESFARLCYLKRIAI
eukprot:PhF_6_TR4902/c0_g1_i2/m.6947